jgi:hypothetical protein
MSTNRMGQELIVIFRPIAPGFARVFGERRYLRKNPGKARGYRRDVTV